jgi:hypothetical protein
MGLMAHLLILRIIKNMSSTNGINIILYPREYNKRGHETLHSVRGITSSGDEVNVKLRVPEKYKTHDNFPKISELASVDVKSKRYCLSSSVNSKSNREGILLFSGAKKEPIKKNKIDTYIASWVEVLSNGANSPVPIYGFGRMDVNKKSKKTASLKKQLNFHIENNSPQDLINDLQSEVDNPKNYSYSAIHYIHKKVMNFSHTEKIRLKDYFVQVIDNYTKIGKVGGVMIRSFDRNGLVIKSSYKEFFPRYSVVSSGIQIGKITFEDIKDDLFSVFDLPGAIQHEIVPLVKITTGPKSSEYYGDKERYSRLLNMFFDDNLQPKICKMVSRITEYIESGTTLLYKTFPLTIALGHPAKLSKDGIISLRFNSESIGSEYESNQLNLNGIECGLTNDKSMIKRAYWMLGENSNSVKYYDEIFSKNNKSERVENKKVIEIDVQEDNVPDKENNSFIVESEGESINDMFFSDNKNVSEDNGKVNNSENHTENDADNNQILDEKIPVKELTGMAAYLARKKS